MFWAGRRDSAETPQLWSQKPRAADEVTHGEP